MNDLSTKSTFGVGAKRGSVVHGIKATTCCLVRILNTLLRFGIDDAEGNGVEVSTHAVHAESDQSNLFTTPIEGSIRVPLRLPFAVLCARHVIEHTRGGEGYKPYAVTELMPE